MLKSYARIDSHGEPVNGEIVMEKKPRKKTGGRKPGSLNRKTIIGKNISDTLKAWIGLDDESVARTGMIDGEGYRGRLALRQMWNDERPVDPQFVALAKFLFGYAYGTPGKHQQGGVQRQTLVFASVSGHVPWSPLAPGAAEMNARSAAMNAAKENDLRMKALEAAKPDEVIIDVKKGDTEIDGEVLEAVVPPPEDDPGAHGGGRRGR
jgi:hypothetical protein